MAIEWKFLDKAIPRTWCPSVAFKIWCAIGLSKQNLDKLRVFAIRCRHKTSFTCFTEKNNLIDQLVALNYPNCNIRGCSLSKLGTFGTKPIFPFGYYFSFEEKFCSKVGVMVAHLKDFTSCFLTFCDRYLWTKESDNCMSVANHTNRTFYSW